MESHRHEYDDMNAWYEAKLAYLAVKENVTSSESAKQHISLLEAFQRAHTNLTSARVPAFKQLGQVYQFTRH